MTDVQTVTGPVSAESLGTTLPHEHVIIDHMLDNWMPGNLLSDPVLAELELRAAREAGVSTVVDQTGRGVHRDPLVLRDLSESAGVNIVTGTGWFKERFYDLDFPKMKADALAAIMVADLTDGIAETGVRAGLIGEINVHARWVTPGEERMHRAAARAQKVTGAALAVTGTHTSTVMDQLDILEEEGADLRRVVVDHVNGIADHELHSAIATRGPFTCFSSFPIGSPTLLDRDARLVKEMVRAGLADHVLVSTGVSTRSQLAAYGGAGYGFAAAGLWERLGSVGLSGEEWDQIMVINPRRALTGG